MSMGKKVAELNTLSDGKGITGIRFFNQMEDTNESTNLRKLADVWMSKNRCCQGHRNRSAVSVTRITVDIGHPSREEEEVNQHRFRSQICRKTSVFTITPRSQNHRSRVPNPSWASIAAALPLKHVETRKNVVQNSTKTKQFCRIFHFENNPHAQKWFVIIVGSGFECSVIVLCVGDWMEVCWVMAIGDRGRLRPVVGGL